MAALTCDICGGSLSMDASGDFAVCDSCGMKHTKERMQTKAQEITGTVKVSNQASIESLMKRGYLALEDEKWSDAGKYFEQVLDIDPEYAPAYVGKLCIYISESAWLVKNDLFTDVVKKEADLARYYKPLDDMSDYQKAIRFADEAYRAQLEGYNNEIKKRIVELKSKYSFLMIIGQDALDTFKNGSLSINNETRTFIFGYLRDGSVFKILRTGKQYRYESDAKLKFIDRFFYVTGGSDSIDDYSIYAGDIAVITITSTEEERKEQERLYEQEKRAREERERPAKKWYHEGKAAYEEGKKSLFFRKKKYQEAFKYFSWAAEEGHAEAREYLDRLKAEMK